MKLIILDRDGVINYDSEYYIKSPDEWHEIPGSLDAIAKLYHAGYQIAVASNQSGVRRGYYSEQTLTAIHDKMQNLLAQRGAFLDKIVYCPHLPSEHCKCRKPQTGLLEQIADYFACSLEGVPFIGDRVSDVQAALKVGAIPVFIGTDDLSNIEQNCQIKIYKFKNLSEAVDNFILGKQ